MIYDSYSEYDCMTQVTLKMSRLRRQKKKERNKTKKKMQLQFICIYAIYNI